MLFFILTAVTMMTFAEVPSLVKKKRWKDVFVFFGFILVVIALGIVLIFKFPFPTLTKVLEATFKPVTELIMREG